MSYSSKLLGPLNTLVWILGGQKQKQIFNSHTYKKKKKRHVQCNSNGMTSAHSPRLLGLPLNSGHPLNGQPFRFMVLLGSLRAQKQQRRAYCSSLSPTVQSTVGSRRLALSLCFQAPACWKPFFISSYLKWLSCKPLNCNLKSVSQDTHVPCDVESVDITTTAAETTPYVEEVAQVSLIWSLCLC